MNKFLIVSTMSPQSVDGRTFRGKIFRAFLRQFDYIPYTNFKILLVGADMDIPLPSAHYLDFVSTDLRSKESRLDFLKSYIPSRYSADYILRLDDDDFLDPNLFEKLKDFTGRAYYDKKHYFVDVATGRISSQERGWMPNTSVMRMDDAFAEPWEKGKALFFNYDHDWAWYNYFSDKNPVASEKPVYLRLLSPFTITSAGSASGNKLEGISWGKYFAYCKKFGEWSETVPNGFERITKEIDNIWTDFYGKSKEPLFYEKLEAWGRNLSWIIRHHIVKG